MYWTWIIMWAIIVIVSIVIEINTVSLTSIWFAIAGIVSLILAAFTVELWIQVVVFIVLSLVLLFATKPFTKKFMDKSVIRTNADKVVSMIGVVTKKICVGEIGEIKVNNEVWRAISLDTDDIEEGEKVIVNSLNGNKLLVSRVEKKDNIDTI